MVAILDLPEARERVVRWSVEENERFVELWAFRKNVEMIRGVIVNKDAELPEQTHIAHALHEAIMADLPDGFFVLHKSPLRLTDSEPEPDVSVVRGHKNEYRDRHPTTAALVIEVAVTSVTVDRENAGLYAEAGVEEYWIVLPKQRQVEVYRDPKEGVYNVKLLCDAPAILECACVPEVRVDLEELFRAV